MDEKYSLSTIKKVFWDTFHESGEWWFCYFPECKQKNQEITEYAWSEFVNDLRKNHIK